jgi:hypothetical protein
MKKLIYLFAGLLGCLVIGCASSIKYTTGDGFGEKKFVKTLTGPYTERITDGSFPWEYQPVTVIVSPETRTAEFTAQWVGVDKSVVLRTFGEPTQRVPYPTGFNEECWYYLIRNTKWFVFFNTFTNKVIDIQYQNPGQPMMTTGMRASGALTPAVEPAPPVIVDPIPPGYKPYRMYRK